jgi:hypothetical protein
VFRLIYVAGTLLTTKRHAIYVQCITDGRSRKHCRGGKSVKITYSECVSAARYSACKAHTPYYHMWQVWLYIFPHYLVNRTIFGKPLFNIICVLIFSTSFVTNIYRSKKNSARYQKSTQVFM